MRQNWQRITIALTEKEADKLKVVKKYLNMNSHQIMQRLIEIGWEKIQGKYKKNFEKKWGKKKEIGG
ncbi:MAG: hypothetical protein M1135_01670 [Candidatus Omnitrophica bacterium]|nr:hypothetical protein [Candidatus Omnitrophota bacterium]